MDGTEHEVSVVEAQVLLVGVGGEGSTAARPVLERGGRGFAGERADVGIQAAADLARVDDDDLTRAACLGVTVQVDLEPTVLKGGVVTLVELAKKMKMPVTMNFMDVSSYGDGTESSGHIKILRDLDEDITGKNVLLVEDIIDSGRTLSKLRTLLIQRNPKKLKLCTLLDKPDRRVTEVPVDYVGFTIPDAFVVGYGLDYAQKYRNLDYVGVVHFEEE